LPEQKFFNLVEHQTSKDWVYTVSGILSLVYSSSILWLPTGKRIKYNFYLIPSRYDFLTSFLILWIFVNIFRVFSFIFLYSLEIINISIIQTNFGKYPPDFHFLLKIFSIFFFMILSSDIFLFPFKISQKNSEENLHGTHLFGCRKGCQVFYCFLPGNPFISPHVLSSYCPDSEILPRLIIKTSEENSHRYSPPLEMA